MVGHSKFIDAGQHLCVAQASPLTLATQCYCTDIGKPARTMDSTRTARRYPYPNRINVLFSAETIAYLKACLLKLDIGVLNDLAPLLDFLAQEIAQLLRRTRFRFGACRQ